MTTTTGIEVGTWARDPDGRVVQVTALKPMYRYDSERRMQTDEVESYMASVRGIGTGSSMLDNWLNPDTMNLRGDWTGGRSLDELQVIDNPAEIEEARQRGLDAEEREIKKFIASLEARLKRVNRERELD